MVAALAVRWQTSRAKSGVSDAWFGWLISDSVCAMRSSEIRLRNGDCSSCAERPCLSVPSNTGSPVVLVKSARTMVSVAPSACAVPREKNSHAPMAAPRITTAAIGAMIFQRPRSFRCCRDALLR